MLFALLNDKVHWEKLHDYVSEVVPLDTLKTWAYKFLSLWENI